MKKLQTLLPAFLLAGVFFFGWTHGAEAAESQPDPIFFSFASGNKMEVSLPADYLEEARLESIVLSATDTKPLKSVAPATKKEPKQEEGKSSIATAPPSPSPQADLGPFVLRALESPGGGRIQNKQDPAPSDVVVVNGYAGRRVPLQRDGARAWQAMVAAARADGLGGALLQPISGYRSYQSQLRLWNEAVRNFGAERAPAFVARPGSSAHQSGRAIDLYIGGTNSPANIPSLRRLAAYKWLLANAQRFGFYPYETEPWHWEYNPPAN